MLPLNIIIIIIVYYVSFRLYNLGFHLSTSSFLYSKFSLLYLGCFNAGTKRKLNTQNNINRYCIYNCL